MQRKSLCGLSTCCRSSLLITLGFLVSLRGEGRMWSNVLTTFSTSPLIISEILFQVKVILKFAFSKKKTTALGQVVPKLFL